MDNTVGSLTQFQKSVVIGSILGDGYLRIIPKRKNAFLEINHSYGAKEYVNWKYEILKNFCISPPKKRKGNGNRIAYRFFTKQHPEFTKLHKEFYKGNRKNIPSSLELNPTILSIWFMDDGSRCSNSDFYLNTQKFSLTEQINLTEKLRNLGLQTTINKDKSYYRLRFLVSSIAKLKGMLKPNLIFSMRYKIGL